MTKTEYIGARYAPIFADPVEWSSTHVYEPLTIVIHDGDSYTSKRAVPIGIEITDTEYWVRTGIGSSGTSQRVTDIDGDDELWTDDAYGDREATVVEIGDIVLINLTCDVMFNNESTLDVLKLPNDIELRGIFGVIYAQGNYKGEILVGSSDDMVAVTLNDLAFSGSIRATAWGIKSSLA